MVWRFSVTEFSVCSDSTYHCGDPAGDAPWAHAPGREPPVIDTLAVLRNAPGTDQSHGVSIDAIPNERASGQSVTAGGDAHEHLLSSIVTYLEGQGHEAWIEEQDGSSLPDGYVRFHDETLWHLEAEHGNLSKPANVLTNWARAYDDGRPVAFVVGTERKAHRLFEQLHTPWKTVTEHGPRRSSDAKSPTRSTSTTRT
jgi:hypothetical protein